ncbi:tumor protein p53-inducible nuclear protein 2 [Puntigrus tetrazona]|uniref:tumor protein p53-inducible nuclear protein 2 n=1 Tax=Puntigrus tetrazona TaxID=1606681 RepID=UPI001C8AEDEF|nr:tumor protein p53-inducible nuclear protein 2 [Puntigrus tetrazona]XP_043108557.1 tumor protein p53-inducible nuclear protein 2 [Puntigrus tetrazona]XP_043108558.1 tumor protein p53-inducible nuclear protein 2 [Puntigrus tetrazona]
MFQRLTNLFFGRVSETTEEPNVPKPGSPEVDEEGWLLVNAADGEASPEPNDVHLKLIGNLSSTEKCAASLVSETSMVEPEVPVARSSSRVSQRVVSQAGALVKVSQVGRIQRAQARSSRHNLSRNCIQRQNHIRQRLPQHCSRIHRVILNQPSRRNFSH